MKILNPPSQRGPVLHYIDVDTAAGSRHDTWDVINPIGILTLGKLSPGSIQVRERTSDLPQSQALRDAIGAFHALGEQHGVGGISLTDNTSLYGSLDFTDDDARVYTAGGPTLDRLGNGDREAGRAIANEITAAARAVIANL